MEAKFQRDRPTRVDREGSDPLGQRLALNTLEAALTGYETPACMALYGAWGSGKTTLLRSAFEDFKGPKVWFDPWQYAQTGDVRTALLMEVAAGLGVEEGSPGWDKVKSIGKALGSFAFRAGLGYLFGKQVMPELENAGASGFKVEEAAAYFQSDQVVNEVRQIKDSFKALVDLALIQWAEVPKEGVPRPPADRVLICLDDLDRCLPSDVVTLIEAVKLLLVGDEGCRAVFAFALDRQIVGEAIRQQYPGASLYTGENYLEKVFDLSLEVPPVQRRPALMQHLKALIDGIPLLNDRDADGKPVPVVFGDPMELSIALASPALGNPRVLKRALNRLVLLHGNVEIHGKLMMLRGTGEVATCRQRFLAWLAGTERFRSFRQFFRRATSGELDTLDEAFRQLRKPSPNNPPLQITSEIRQFLDTPGFVEFFEKVLDGGARKQQQVGWNDLKEVTSSQQLMTIGQFDQLMRLAGL